MLTDLCFPWGQLHGRQHKKQSLCMGQNFWVKRTVHCYTENPFTENAIKPHSSLSELANFWTLLLPAMFWALCDCAGWIMCMLVIFHYFCSLPWFMTFSHLLIFGSQCFNNLEIHIHRKESGWLDLSEHKDNKMDLKLKKLRGIFKLFNSRQTATSTIY